jgi:hypothetical protein
MNDYFERNHKRSQFMCLPRVFRTVRTMPTYPGCDPYNALLGFSAYKAA